MGKSFYLSRHTNKNLQLIERAMATKSVADRDGFVGTPTVDLDRMPILSTLKVKAEAVEDNDNQLTQNTVDNNQGLQPVKLEPDLVIKTGKEEDMDDSGDIEID